MKNLPTSAKNVANVSSPCKSKIADVGKKTIVISPYSRTMPDGTPSPKNYPYWPQVITKLKKLGYHIIQIGMEGEKKLKADEFLFNKSLKELKELLTKSHTFISVDNFLGHYGSYVSVRGVVIFSQSDPEIFGYKSNINLLKDRAYLRKHQFARWKDVKPIQESFVGPNEVVKAVQSI